MFVKTTGGTVEVDDEEDDDELPAPKGPPLVVYNDYRKSEEDGSEGSE